MTIVFDYGENMVKGKANNQIPAGEFKAKCLKIMDEVQRTKQPLVVTKHGKPVVTIMPFEAKKPFPFGYMKGRITTKGDIVGPTGERWDADMDD